MTTISHSAAATLQPPMMLPLRDSANAKPGAAQLELPAAENKPSELREKFTQFVGEAFFGQMIKAMRSTVGKPAYFHGGRGEEVFQSQLDQKMAEHLTETSASRVAEPMFERQFPKLAENAANASLQQLHGLRRY